MTTKYNCKHPDRGHSRDTGEAGYQKRLHDRGLGKAPRMEPLEDLRKRQERRVRETCTVSPDHDGHKCNGVPWPTSAELAAELADNAAQPRQETPKAGPPRSARPRDTRPPRAPREGRQRAKVAYRARVT